MHQNIVINDPVILGEFINQYFMHFFLKKVKHEQALY